MFQVKSDFGHESQCLFHKGKVHYEQMKLIKMTLTMVDAGLTPEMRTAVVNMLKMHLARTPIMQNEGTDQGLNRLQRPSPRRSRLKIPSPGPAIWPSISDWETKQSRPCSSMLLWGVERTLPDFDGVRRMSEPPATVPPRPRPWYSPTRPMVSRLLKTSLNSVEVKG